MATQDDRARLDALEQRLNQLEGGGQSGGQTGEGQTGDDQSGGGQVSPYDAAQVQAFMQGALMGASFVQQAPDSQGGSAQFLSIFSCPGDGGGGGGIPRWNPTKYDSFFWCKSRFFCNPQSLSCLC